MSLATLRDQSRSLFEEQTGNLLGHISAKHDFAQQARERLPFGFWQLGERRDQAVLSGFRRALEQAAPRTSQAEIDTPTIALRGRAAHVAERDQATHDDRNRALIRGRARRQ